MQIITSTLAALALARQAIAAPAASTVKSLQTRQNPQPNMFFWDHINYEGTSITAATTDTLELWDMAELAGRLSSFKLVAAECWMFDEPNGQGNSIYVKNTEVYFIGDVYPGWNDQVRSIHCRTNIN